MKTLLKHAALLDASYQGEIFDVLVENDKIFAIGKDLPMGDSVIDLAGYTLLPGFIDAHIHVATKEDCFPDEPLLAWAHNGVTTVRELGMLCTRSMEDYAPWIAEQNCRPETARLIATGKYIDVPGGYGAGPEPRRVMGTMISNAQEAAAAVDAAKAAGFSGIKIGIADGMPDAPRMTDEEITAICQRAKALGMWTACHIGTSDSLETMIRCGIGEAGHTPSDPMSDELIANMVEKGIPMDTTVGDPDKGIEPPPGMDLPGGPGGPGGMPMMFDPEKMAAEQKEKQANKRENLRRNYKAGGKLVLGTALVPSRSFYKDATIPTGEMRQLLAAGIPFQEIIKAGTISAAEVVGTDQEEGTITVGKSANLIAVKGQVDDSFAALKQVALVMHYGKIIRNELE